MIVTPDRGDVLEICDVLSCLAKFMARNAPRIFRGDDYKRLDVAVRAVLDVLSDALPPDAPQIGGTPQ